MIELWSPLFKKRIELWSPLSKEQHLLLYLKVVFNYNLKVDELHLLVLHDVISFPIVSFIVLQLSQVKAFTNNLMTHVA
jgi:hypothetical protein